MSSQAKMSLSAIAIALLAACAGPSSSNFVPASGTSARTAGAAVQRYEWFNPNPIGRPGLPGGSGVIGRPGLPGGSEVIGRPGLPGFHQPE